MKKILPLAAMAILSIFLWSSHSASAGTNEKTSKENLLGSSDTAVIYFNEACGMCAEYVENSLPALLKNAGIKNIIKKDYVNEKKNRVEMNEANTFMRVPLELQSHIATFVGEKYILGGHIPKHIIKEIFAEENQKRFKTILVYQDLMHGEVKDYKIFGIPNYADDFVGEPMTLAIDESATKYLDYLENNKKELSDANEHGFGNKPLLPVVLVSGFLDGLNPCAFAVLLFFIAFLFSLKRSRGSIWKMGGVYIFAIFLAYILIGFGILKAIMFVNSPHFMAKLGSWLIIGLGFVSIFNYFSTKKIPLKLGIPSVSKKTIHGWMHKATLPAAFVMGFLVGLCTFPCSGGIYVAIIGLLSASTTYWSGVSYLFIYNLMFVLPLVFVLVLAANKYTFVKFGEWQQSHKREQKLIFGVSMVALGLIILLFFV